MTSAVHTALAGLQSAERSLQKSAVDVARAGTTTPQAALTQTGPTVTGAPSAVQVPGATVAAAAQDAPSLTDGLFAAKQAELQYKATAQLLGTLNDLQRDTVDLLG